MLKFNKGDIVRVNEKAFDGRKLYRGEVRVIIAGHEAFGDKYYYTKTYPGYLSSQSFYEHELNLHVELTIESLEEEYSID